MRQVNMQELRRAGMDLPPPPDEDEKPKLPFGKEVHPTFEQETGLRSPSTKAKSSPGTFFFHLNPKLRVLSGILLTRSLFSSVQKTGAVNSVFFCAHCAEGCDRLRLKGTENQVLPLSVNKD